MAENDKLSATRALTPRTVDADTIEIEGRRRRLMGIAASETSTQAGLDAARRAEQFLSQPGVTFEGRGTGYFGRPVGEAFGPPDEEGRRENLNERLIREGLAVAEDFTGAGNLYPKATRAHVRRFSSDRPNAGKSVMGEATQLDAEYTPAPPTLTQSVAAGARQATDSLQAGTYGFASSLASLIAPPEGQDPENDTPLEAYGRQARSTFEKGYMRNTIEASREHVAKSLQQLVESEDTSFMDWMRWGAFNIGVGLPSLGLIIGSGGTGGLVGLGARGALRKMGHGVAKHLKRKGIDRNVANRLADGVVERLPKYGARLGAAMGSGIPQGGSIYEDVKNKYGIDSTATAVTTAAITGGLDVLGLEYVLKGLLPDPKKHLSESIAVNLGKMMAGSSARGIIAEAPIEALQETVALVSEGIHDPDESVLQKLTSEEGRWRILEAAAAGAVFGSVFGGTGGAMSYAAQGLPTKPKDTPDRGEPPPTEEVEAAPPQPIPTDGGPSAFEAGPASEGVDPYARGERNVPPPTAEEGVAVEETEAEEVEAAAAPAAEEQTFETRREALAFAKENPGWTVKGRKAIPPKTQETSDAAEVRSDQGQPDSTGDETQGRQDEGGENLQQPAKARPRASDRKPQAEEKPQSSAVPVTEFTEADRKRGHRAKVEEVEVGGEQKRTVKGRRVVPPEGSENRTLVTEKVGKKWTVVDAATGEQLVEPQTTQKKAVSGAVAALKKPVETKQSEPKRNVAKRLSQKDPKIVAAKKEKKQLEDRINDRRGRALFDGAPDPTSRADIRELERLNVTLAQSWSDNFLLKRIADKRAKARSMQEYARESINSLDKETAARAQNTLELGMMIGEEAEAYAQVAKARGLTIPKADTKATPVPSTAKPKGNTKTTPVPAEGKTFAGAKAAQAYAKQFGGVVKRDGDRWRVTPAGVPATTTQSQSAQKGEQVAPEGTDVNPRVARQQQGEQVAPEGTDVDPRVAKGKPTQEAPAEPDTDPRSASREAAPKATSAPRRAGPISFVGTVSGGEDGTTPGTPVGKSEEHQAEIDAALKAGEPVYVHDKSLGMWLRVTRNKGQIDLEPSEGPPKTIQEPKEAREPRGAWDIRAAKGETLEATHDTARAYIRSANRILGKLPDGEYKAYLRKALQRAIDAMPADKAFREAQIEKELGRAIELATQEYVGRALRQDQLSKLLDVPLVGLDPQYLEKSAIRFNRPTLYAELTKRFPPSRARQVYVAGRLDTSLRVDPRGRPTSWTFTVEKPARTEYLLGRMIRQWAGLLGMTEAAQNMVVTFRSPAENGSESVHAGPYGQAWMDINTIYINAGLLDKGPRGVRDMSLLRKVVAHEFGHFVHEKVVTAAINGTVGVDSPYTVQLSNLLTLIKEMDADYHKWAGVTVDGKPVESGKTARVDALIEQLEAVKTPQELIDFIKSINSLGAELTETRGLFVAEDSGHPLRKAKAKERSEHIKALILRMEQRLKVNKSISKEDLQELRDYADYKLKNTIKGYVLERSEWYADNIGNWLLTEKEPTSLLDRFFRSIANILRRFFGRDLKRAKTDVPPTLASVKDFMDFLREQQIKVPKIHLNRVDTIEPDVLMAAMTDLAREEPALRFPLAVVMGETQQLPTIKAIRKAQQQVAAGLRRQGLKGTDEQFAANIFRALHISAQKNLADASISSLEVNDESQYDFGEVLITDAFDGVTPVIENEQHMIPTGYKIGGLFSRTAEREGIDAIMRGSRRLREVTGRKLPQIYFDMMESMAPGTSQIEGKLDEYAQKLYQSYMLNKQGLLRNPKAPHEINMPVTPMLYEALRPDIKKKIADFVASMNSWNAREQNGVAKVRLEDMFDPNGLMRLYLTFDSSMEGENPPAWRFSIRTHRETKQIYVWHENQHRLHNQVIDVMVTAATRYAKNRLDTARRDWYLDNTLQFIAPMREEFDPNTGKFKIVPPKHVDMAIRVLESFGRSLAPGQRRPGTGTKNPLNQERNVMTAIGELMAQGYVLAETRFIPGQNIEGTWYPAEEINQIEGKKFTRDLVIGFGLGRGSVFRLSTVEERVRGEIATAEEIRWLEAHRERMFEKVETLKQRTSAAQKKLSELNKEFEGNRVPAKRRQKLKDQVAALEAEIEAEFNEVFDILYAEGTPYDAKIETEVQRLVEQYLETDDLIQMRKRIESLKRRREENPDAVAERLSRLLATKDQLESKREALEGKVELLARLADKASDNADAKLKAFMEAKEQGVKGAKMAAIRTEYEEARAIETYTMLRKLQAIDPAYVTDDEIVAAVLSDTLYKTDSEGRLERHFVTSPAQAALKDFNDTVGEKSRAEVRRIDTELRNVVQSINAFMAWAEAQGYKVTELKELGEQEVDAEAYRAVTDQTNRVLHLQRKLDGKNAISTKPEKMAELSAELQQALAAREKAFEKLLSTSKGKSVVDLIKIQTLLQQAQIEYQAAKVKAEARLHEALVEADLGKDRHKTERDMVSRLRVPYELERLQAAYREAMRFGPPPPKFKEYITRLVKQIETYKLLNKLHVNEVTNLDSLNRFLRSRLSSLSSRGAAFWSGREAIDEEAARVDELYGRTPEAEQYGTDMVDYNLPDDQTYETQMRFSNDKGLDPHTGVSLTATQHVESSERNFSRLSFRDGFLPDGGKARENWIKTIQNLYRITGLDRFGIDFDFGFHENPGEPSRVSIFTEPGMSPHKRRITATVLLDPKLKNNPEKLLRDLAHEMAHVMKDALLGVEENKNSAVWRKLMDGYNKYAEGNPEAVAFEEWFADRFADWIVDVTWRGRKPKNAMQKWLNGVVNTIKQMLGIVRGQQSETDAMYEFLDTLAVITTHDMIPDKIYGNYRNGNDAVFDELYNRITRQDPAMLGSSGMVTYFSDGGRHGAIPVSAPEPVARNRVFAMLLNGTKFVWNETTAFVKEIYNNYIRWTNRWLWAQRNENGEFIKAFRAFGLMWADQPGHPRGDVNPETGEWEFNVMYVKLPNGKHERIFLGDETIKHAIERERGKWIEQRLSKLVNDIPDDIKSDVLKHLQAETNISEITDDNARKHVAAIRNYLQSFYKTYIAPMYESKSGAHGEVEYGIKQWMSNYFPRVLDPKVLMERKDEFIRTLTEEVGMSRQRAEEFFNAYLGNDNVDVWYDPDRAFAPGNPQGKPRSQELADFAHLLEPYMAKDITYVMQTYMHSMIKRIEYERRFGGVSYTEGGKPYWDQNIHFERLRKLAEKEGVSQAQMKHFMGVREAYIGRYKEHISPELRKFFSMTQTILNFLLLPFATLSSFVDLANPLIRANGTVKFSWTNFREAMQAVREKGDNRLWRLAQSHGLVVDNVMHSVLSDRFDTSYMTPMYQKMNEKFFRIIGLHQWTAAMRIYAWKMAQDFIHEHATRRTEHGDTYLKELGLTADEVLEWFNQGKKVWEVDPNTSNDDLARKVTLGLNRFVSESVFRPDASQRPLWASDPHWMLVWHLKQFGYSFWANLVHRLIDVAKTRPGALAKFATFLPLLAVLPLAMVGMELRNLIQYGLSDEIPYNHQQGVDGYFAELVERSGVLGPTQFLWDALSAQERGKLFILSLMGPAATMTERVATGEPSSSIPLFIPGVSAMPPMRHWMTEQLAWD